MGNTCSLCKYSGGDAKVHPEPIIPIEFNSEEETEESNVVQIDDKVQQSIENQTDDKEQNSIDIQTDDEEQKSIDIQTDDEEQKSIDIQTDDKEQNSIDIQTEDKEQKSIDIQTDDEEQKSIDIKTDDEEQPQMLSFMKTIKLKQEERVFICGDIEGNSDRFIRVFHAFCGMNCFDSNWKLKIFPDHTYLVFLGDILSHPFQQTIHELTDNDNTILTIIEQNYELFHHISINSPSNQGNLEEIVMDLNQKRFKGRVDSKSRIFVIEGNHDLEIVKMLKNGALFDKNSISIMKWTPNAHKIQPHKTFSLKQLGSPEESFNKILKFCSLLDQTSVLIEFHQHSNTKCLLCHYQPDVLDTDYHERCYSFLPPSIQYQYYSIIHGHNCMDSHEGFHQNGCFTQLCLDYSRKDEFKIGSIEGSECIYDPIDLS